ncbi:MAG: radical SAM protein [bacterium]|nr:radical SAM protein [bacterium]
MEKPQSDPQAGELVEESIRALVPEEGRPTFDQRFAALASDDPERWEAVAFPVELAIELAAVCNLKCVMCPVPTTSRPATLMDEAVFRSAVDQIGDQKGFVLLPQGFGETMLHRKWADLVGYAVDKGIRPIVMLTNGTLLNEANVERMLELAVDVVLISIDGVDPETYAAVRVGGDLRKVEANVRRLIERRGERRKPTLVMRIIRMQETREEIDAFFERWRPLLHPGDQIQINEYNDWAGKVEDHSVDGMAAQPGRSPCRMLWRNLSVHADGKVSACCLDSEDELIVGDLAQGETIQDIWRGERLRALRRIHREGRFEELPICLKCKNWY